MKPGEIIGDKYRIIDLLGQGATSLVFLAENLALNNLWAIKAVSKQSPWFSLEMQETAVLKDLSHPMLPRVTDLLEDEDTLYMVMDYISGTNLLCRVQEKGKIDENILIQWTRELLDVLSYLHGRNPPIIYRDLKPSNLIIDAAGRLNLVDFGTARIQRESSGNDTVYIGTEGYAAPEQYGAGQSSPQSDLYNLGMTLVHLAAGIHPVNIDISRVRAVLKQAGISDRYARFILGLIQYEPEKRFQDCHAAIKELDSVKTGGFGLFAKHSPRNPESGVRRTVIGISGALPGNGVTSFCLSLGYYYSKQGYKTALGELNPSGDFDRLREIFDEAGEIKLQTESKFEAKGIEFYPCLSEGSRIPRRGLDIIILDLGHLRDGNGIKELNRADIKIILCPSVPWKQYYMLNFKEKFGECMQEEWIYVLRSKHHQDYILKKKCGLRPIVHFPPSANHIGISSEERKAIGKALNRIYRLSGRKAAFI